MGSVLILLPPSEGKAPSGSGPAVDPADLLFPKLKGTRTKIMRALVRVAAGRPETALRVLGLSAGQASELEANVTLFTAPTLPAADRYTGVLYETLGLPDLRTSDPDAYARAESSVLTFSGLWGVVRPSDAIPAYRCSGGVALPRIGAVSKLWRDALAPAMEPIVEGRLIVDMRSSAYTPLWRIPSRLSDQTVTVRVLHESVVDGALKRTVVSHFNKATKGRLTRALLVANAAPTTPKEWAEACEDLGYRVELAAGAKPGAPWGADVIVDSV
jgi:uncharacterized protein